MSCHTQFQNGFLFITTGTGNDLARCLKWGGGNNYSNKIIIWKSGLCFKIEMVDKRIARVGLG